MYSNLLKDLEKDISGDWEDIRKRLIKHQEKEFTKTCEEFHSLLDSLIELNKKRRKILNEKRNLHNILNLKYYLMEYCTIRLNIGRQTGKSSYVMKNMKDNDLLIVRDRARIDYRNRIGNKKIVTIHEMKNRETYGFINNFDTIWIEDASYIMMNKVLNDMVYERFGRNINQTFIFLG